MLVCVSREEFLVFFSSGAQLEQRWDKNQTKGQIVSINIKLGFLPNFLPIISC